MNDLNDLKKLADNLKKSMDKLVKIQTRVFDDLPNDLKQSITPIQKDIKSALKSLKKGDAQKINELQKRYADTNSK
jgi:hypothetical protein